MRRLLAAAVVLVAASWAPAQSVTLPKEIQSKANRPVFVNPTVDGDDLHWEIPAGLDDWISMLPPEIQKNFGYTKIFYAEPGTYTLRAWTAKVVDGKAKLSPVAVCVIVIGDKPVPPVPPGPVPPVPPTPPIPTDNPFAEAWRLEVRADRVSSAKGVATLYEGYATDVLAVKEDKKTPLFATGRQLFDYMSTTYIASGHQGKLPNVVAAVNHWIALNLKTPAGALSATDRQAAADAFVKVARWLRELQ